MGCILPSENYLGRGLSGCGVWKVEVGGVDFVLYV